MPRVSPLEKLSFRTQMIAGIAGAVLLTGVVIIWLAHRSSQASTEQLVDQLFREVSAHAVTNTRSFVLRAGPIVQSLRQFAEDADSGLELANPDRLARQLLMVLEENPGLSWVYYGDESGTFTGVYRTPKGELRVNQSYLSGGKSPLVEYEVQADGSWKPFLEKEDNQYDPRTRPWYLAAVKQQGIVWSEPYIFFDQGVPGITCSVPVKDVNGKVQGVLGVDFDLNALSEFVTQLALSEHSDIFLFMPDQTLLAHPKLRVQMITGQGDAGKMLTLADAEDPLMNSFRAALPKNSLKTTAEESYRRFEFRHQGVPYLASITPFRLDKHQTWIVGAIAPKSEFLGDVWKSQATALAAAVGAMLLGTILALALARSVSGPVLEMIAFMRRVGDGDLETQATFGGNREFRQLAAALNHMIGDLRDRLRLRHSLGVAMQVQQRLLPGEPPQVPGLDIAGHSTYCDETGGDYYDFLVLDEVSPHTMLVALGDVMGHGVAAALVMAGARAVLRDRAGATGGLSALMGRLNRLLAADHEGNHFMTMHLSLVDGETGNFRWVSAGHDPAMIYDPTHDEFEEIDEAGLPLGVMDDAEYEEYSHKPLGPGQIMLVGTDGVWEMPNDSGEQFGKDRLREVIRRCAKRPAAELVEQLLAALKTFRGECRPTDDVTFVVIKRLPN